MVLAHERRAFVNTVLDLLLTGFGAALFSAMRASILSTCIARMKVLYLQLLLLWHCIMVGHPCIGRWAAGSPRHWHGRDRDLDWEPGVSWRMALKVSLQIPRDSRCGYEACSSRA